MVDHSIALPAGPYSNTRARGLRRPISRTEFVRYSSLLAIGILPYLNTLWNGLVYDDQYQIVQNPFLRSFHFVGTMFTTSVWAFQVKHGTVTYYRPLMSLSYLLIYQLIGPVPYAYHLANVLLHGVVVVLIFLVSRRIFGSEPLAWISVVWFALHPIHTEVVAWVASVPDIQMTFFLLLAFWFYLSLGKGVRHSGWILMASCGCFVLALLSKEPAITFPGIVFLCDWVRFFPHDKAALRRHLLCQIPLWIISVVYLYFRFFVLSGIVPNAIRASMAARQVAMSAVSLFGHYMEKLVWPGTAGAAYRFEMTSTVKDPQFLVGVASVCAIGAAFIFFWRTRRPIAVGIIWMVLPLLPVLDAKVMASNVFAERYLYLPSIGFCWVAGELVVLAWKSALLRRRFALRVALAGLGITACSFASYAVVRRNTVWHDEARLFASILRQDPTNPTAHADLGAMYWNSGRKKEARAEWTKALAVDPQNFFALDNLGISAASEKRYGDAILYFRRAIAARPGFPKPHAHLAEALLAMGDARGAETEFQKSLELSPFDVDTRNAYAKFCLNQSRPQDAEQLYRESLSVAPTSLALDALGQIAMDSKNVADAEKLFQQSVELDPFDAQAHFGLGEAYWAAGRLYDAKQEYQRGLNTDPSNRKALDALHKLGRPSN